MTVIQFEDNQWSKKIQGIEFRHREALSLIDKGPVLDVGSGDGLFLNMLREKGYKAHGVDLSHVAVKRSREDGLEATLLDISAERLPFSDGSFSYAVALDVFEHLYDPARILSEMIRVSTEGVIIGVPNFSSLPARLQTLCGRVPENNTSKKGHIYWFNWRVLSELVETHCLRMQKLKTNVVLERVPIIGFCMRLLASIWPNLFALSFVVRCKPIR